MVAGSIILDAAVVGILLLVQVKDVDCQSRGASMPPRRRPAR